ncbi:MAG: peptidoglycan glycosyltransferase [Actinobacteria bacterium HGW-Actinobacteria-4]|nr:MAG: peptidoglycan glycosyltransferase [Actinobacteria bacterium HGW-Actinobacteria-4]
MPGPRPSQQRSVAPRVGNPVVRQRVVSLAMLAVLIVFAGQLVMIQGVQASELSAQALEQRLVTTTIASDRADILDRNGTVLATTVNRYHVTVNQRDIAGFVRKEGGQVVAEGPVDAARILAPILGMSESELAAALTGDKRFAYVAKSVTPETWDLVHAENIHGISFERSAERLYPNHAIAGNIVGFVGGREDRQGTNWGIAGIEALFEDELLGTPGSMTYERGRQGHVIPTGVREEQPAVPGSDVVLTIDRDIQWYVQQQLEEALRSTGAPRGIIVITDVATGEVIALADSATVDPNNPGASDPSNRGSRAVSNVFEPGSTSKVITMAAVLEEGIATPTSRYVAPFSYTTANNETFTDSHEHPDQKLTLAGVLVTSSNTGTIQIGQQLTVKQRYDYLKAFGFGERTHVGLPGESPGILHPYEKWDGRSKYAVLYGQSVSVTALQTNQVYATIANGGVMPPTTIVKGYQLPDGTFEPRDVGDSTRVISEETASALMLMLEQVTEEGTGRLARIDGYRVAGKTGTAQADDGKGGLTSIVSSFVGVAPADDPRIVVSVILFDPKTSIWGGEVAAPVFKDVTTFTLQALRVPPSGPREEFYPTTWE